MGGKTGTMLVGPGRPYDLILVCIAVLAGVLLPVFGVSGLFSEAISFLAVFFTPGYAITAALFPGNKVVMAQSFFIRREEKVFNITMLERLALSVGLSLTVVALVGVVISRGVIGINQLSVSVEVLTITLFFSVYAGYRRSRLPQGDQFAIITGNAPRTRFNSLEKGVAVMIALSLVVLVAVSLNTINSKQAVEGNTEFYILGTDGKLESLPQSAAAGAQTPIQMTVVNHESSSIQYDLIVGMDGDGNYTSISGFDIASPFALSPNEGRMVSFTVGPGESYTKVLTFTSASTGHHTVFFDLNDGKTVKKLWAQIDVVS